MVVSPIVAAFPIICIVSVTAVKDGFEDYKRWKADQEVNRRKTCTLSTSQWRNYNYPDVIRKSVKEIIRSKVHHTFTSLPDHSTSALNANNFNEPSIPIEIGSGITHWQHTKWKKLRVGDFVLLQNNEAIPADIVILSTSEQDCMCYVETKNLDGETNLKLRQGCPALQWLKTADDCASRIKLIVESEGPATNMLRYNGTMYYIEEDKRTTEQNEHSETSNEMSLQLYEIPHSKRVPIDINGILLRGAVLINTKWAIGVVVFTGDDTKQIMNFGKTPSKRTNIDILMNKHVAINLSFMVLLCLVIAIAYPFWFTRVQSEDAPFVKYLSFQNPFLEGFINFWSGLILFQNIVPISLYLSIEIVKTIQAYFIFSDIDMYYEEKDTPCLPRSWNLSDDLGQVEYIFSDKTGTLTRNVMAFKKCSIGGFVFDGLGKRSQSDLNIPQSSRQYTHRSQYSFTASWLDGIHGKLVKNLSSDKIDENHIKINIDEPANEESGQFNDEALNQYLENATLAATQQGKIVKIFFILLSTCHTVLVDDAQDQHQKSTIIDNRGVNISYNAQSPDEACLVTLAAETGFVFRGREHNHESGENEMILDILGEDEKFTLLNVIEFDSDRKRMSVILRPQKGSDNHVLLFCKGADTVIFDRLAPAQAEIRERTQNHLDEFAQEGLRTLCLAYRKIDKDKYKEWASRHAETAAKVFSDPNLRARALEALYNEIEINLVLLGATAIEDKLQEGVPECITTLSKAGIKIWVLTGDKMETAINVGFLCGLLKSTITVDELENVAEADMVLIQISNASNLEEILHQLQTTKIRFFSPTKIGKSAATSRDYALVIDGSSLKVALDDEQAKTLLLEIGCSCKAVICCRVSPLQKAKVVELVKKGKKVLTLAIGDGANDVSMIQAADIGIGISGEEGLQAAMSSDYAIAQFRFLSKLLLVHGRWCYSRIGFLILNFNLKSMVFTLVLFWFQFYSGYASSIIYDFSYMLYYNLVFTNLPILALGIFDQFISPKVLLAFPQVYGTEGIPHLYYSDKKFYIYFVEALWQSLICYFIPVAFYGEGPSNSSGLTISSIHLGTVMAVSAITTVNISVAIDLHVWNWIVHLCTWLTVCIIYIYILLYSYVPNTPVLGLSPELYPDLTFWLTAIFCVMMSLAPRFLFYFGTRVLRPYDSQLLEEMDLLIRQDKFAELDLNNDISLTSLPSHKISSTSLASVAHQSITSVPQLTPTVLRRRASNASSIRSYNMGIDKEQRFSGFSFSSPRGMANVILKAPINAITNTIKKAGSIPSGVSKLSLSLNRSKLHISEGETTVENQEAPPVEKDEEKLQVSENEEKPKDETEADPEGNENSLDNEKNVKNPEHED